MEGIACILGSIFAAAALVCTYLLFGYVLRARERERKLKINTNALECAEDLISDYYKEYDMTDCARKWQQERRNQNEQHT